MPCLVLPVDAHRKHTVSTVPTGEWHSYGTHVDIKHHHQLPRMSTAIACATCPVEVEFEGQPLLNPLLNGQCWAYKSRSRRGAGVGLCKLSLLQASVAGCGFSMDTRAAPATITPTPSNNYWLLMILIGWHVILASAFMQGVPAGVRARHGL